MALLCSSLGMIRYILVRVFLYNLGFYYLLELFLFGQVSFLNKGDKVCISKDAFVQSGEIFVVTNFII